jgi:hypothetical protein
MVMVMVMVMTVMTSKVNAVFVGSNTTFTRTLHSNGTRVFAQYLSTMQSGL